MRINGGMSRKKGNVDWWAISTILSWKEKKRTWYLFRCIINESSQDHSPDLQQTTQLPFRKPTKPAVVIIIILITNSSHFLGRNQCVIALTHHPQYQSECNKTQLRVPDLTHFKAPSTAKSNPNLYPNDLALVCLLTRPSVTYLLTCPPHHPPTYKYIQFRSIPTKNKNNHHQVDLPKNQHHVRINWTRQSIQSIHEIGQNRMQGLSLSFVHLQ